MVKRGPSTTPRRRIGQKRFSKLFSWTLGYFPYKQGSSENEGKSDYYDRSEFRSFLTAVTPTDVAPIAVIVTVFT